MPTTPLLLVDNVFDNIVQYPTAILSATSELAGHETWHVADGRRDRTYWMPTTSAAFHFVRVDLGAGVTRAINYLWLDRGHNLWGATIGVHGGTAFGTWGYTQGLTLPAAGTLGGDPTTGFAATEEGACYTLLPLSSAYRYWEFAVDTAMQPLVTGLMLGTRHQYLNYLTARDEDAGERVQRTETSDAGYRATGKIYDWRRLDLPTRLIGAPEYDSTIRDLRTRLFKRQEPVFVVVDYVAKPERGWLYEFDGTRWSAPMTGVYREHTIPLRELGALAG
jgi:hypothetical protein